MEQQTNLSALLLADLAQNWKHRGLDRRPTRRIDLVRGLADIRFLPVVLLRVASGCSARPGFVCRVAGRALALSNRLLFGIECAPQSVIGPGLYFPHTGGIVIGAERIGARCVLYHQVTLGAKSIDMAFTPGMRPIVGDDVILAAGSKILGGVHIGDHATVAANAVVVHDVDRGDVVGGVPASSLRADS